MQHESSSEELDYMEDFFIKQCEKEETLQPTSTIQENEETRHLRKCMAIAKKQKDWKSFAHYKRLLNRYSMKEKMLESIEEGISKSKLNEVEGGKGFQLLLKMGYKQGEGLGSKRKGIVEPINHISENLKFQTKRAGIGTKTKTQKIKKRKEVKEEEQIETIEEYRKRMKERHEATRKRRKLEYGEENLEEFEDEMNQNEQNDTNEKIDGSVESDSSYGDDFDDYL